MGEQKSSVSKAELRQLAEWLAIFQKLPEKERIAIQYYIKGRIDAEADNVEIPPKWATPTTQTKEISRKTVEKAKATPLK